MTSLTLTDAERRRVEQIDALVATGASGVDTLLGMLDDSSWTVRRAVIASLAALGDEAVQPLCDWLIKSRTSEAGIAAAIDALVASMSTRVAPVVSKLLLHERPAVAADAAIILGRSRAQTAVPELAAQLHHPDDNVAMAAIEALGAIGGGSVIEPLIQLVETKNFFRTFPALHVLATSSDPRSVAAIAKLIDDPLYRDDAVRALGRTGSPLAVEPISRAVEVAPIGTIAHALADLIDLARWAGSEQQVVQELVEKLSLRQALFAVALETAEPDEAAACITVLGAICGSESVPILARWIDDRKLRPIARRALEQCTRRSPEAIATLYANPDPKVRAFGLESITARSSIPIALAALADEDGEVRARGCAALARLGAVEAVPRLFELLADRDPRVPHAASGALDSLGSSEARMLASKAARSDEPQVRRHALRIAAYLGVPDTFDLAVEALDSADDKLRAAAISVLGVLEDPRSTAKLGELARNRDEQVRIAAMRAVSRRSGAEMSALLERGIEDDSAWVRYHACQGLGLQGNPVAAGILIGRLADPMPHVRIAAIEALARLPSPLAWQTLSSFARSSDPELQRVALAGLALHDPDAALDHLLTGLESEDLAIRLVALSGLANVRSPAALAAIVRVAGGDAIETRDAAISLLSERSDPAAASALVELAINSTADHPAREAIAQPREALAIAIGERLATTDVATAQRLCGALGAMGDRAGATATLFAQLASANPAARRAAAAVLAGNRITGAASVIAKLAYDDPDPEVRAVCAVLGAR